MASSILTNPPFDPDALAPPPWKVGGRAWIIPYQAPNGVLPEDAYPIFDRNTPYVDQTVNGTFKGGGGTIMIMRYEKSSVGPYDELSFMPGRFSNPVNDQIASRVTTIYVSSKGGLRSGRIFWGTPKYLAKFSFTTDPSTSATHVTVALPDSEDKPFFRCTLTPARYFPSIYVPVCMAPWPALVQPPIPRPLNGSSLLVGRKEWVEACPCFPINGWMRLVWPKGGLPGGKYGDGKAIADFEPKSWGIELTGFEGYFGDGKPLVSASKKTE